MLVIVPPPHPWPLLGSPMSSRSRNSGEGRCRNHATLMELVPLVEIFSGIQATARLGEEPALSSLRLQACLINQFSFSLLQMSKKYYHLSRENHLIPVGTEDLDLLQKASAECCVSMLPTARHNGIIMRGGCY